MQQPDFEETLLSLIQQVLQATTTQGLQNEETVLGEMLKGPSSLSAVFSIFQKRELSQNVFSYLQIILKSYSKMGDKFNLQQSEFFLSNIILLFENPKFERTQKKGFAEILKSVLAINPITSEHPPAFQNIRHTFFEMFKMNLNSENAFKNLNLDNFENLLTYFSIYYQTAKNDLGEDLFFLDFLIKISDVIIQLMSDIHSEHYSQTQLTNQTNVQTCEKILHIIHLFAKTFRSASQSLLSKTAILNHKQRYVTKALNIGFQLVAIRIGDARSFFRPTNSTKLNSLASKIRAKGIAIFNFMMDTYHTFPTSSKEQNEVDLNEGLASSICVSLVESISFQDNASLSLVKQDKFQRKLLINSIKFMTVCCSDLRFYEFFMNNRNKIIFEVILPLLMTSTEDLEEAVENPDEFAIHNFDFVKHKRLVLIKSVVGRFLDTLCFSIDGILTMVVKLMLEILTNSLSSSPVIESAGMCPLFKHFQTTYFCVNQSPEFRVESALFLLSGLHQLISTRTDLMNQISHLFMNSFRVLITGTPIVRCRLVIFVSCFTDTIFQGTSQENSTSDPTFMALVDVFKWVLSQVEEQEFLSKMATKVLLSFVKKENVNPNLLPAIIENIVGIFNHSILNSDNPNLFHFFRTVVAKYSESFRNSNEYMTLTLQNLISKILQQSNLETKESKGMIDCCFQILSTLANDSELAIKHSDKFDCLWPILFPLLETKEVDFDEDIIEIIITISNATKKMTCHHQRLFNLLPRLQTNNKFQLTQIFPLVNRFLSFQLNDLTSQHISVLLQMIEISISKNENGSESWEYYDADSLTLLHVIIQFASQKFNKDQLAILFRIISVYLDFETLAFNRKVHFLIDKIIGLCFCLFLYFPIDHLDGLASVSFLSNLSQLTFVNLHEFETPYDCKLMTLGIVRILRLLLQNFSENSHPHVWKILNWFVPLLKLQELKPKVNLLNQLSSRRNLNTYESGILKEQEFILKEFPEMIGNYSEFGDVLGNEHLEIETLVENPEAKISKDKFNVVHRIISPLMTVDEYAQFEEVALEIKKQDHLMTQIKTGAINQIALNYFNEVAHRIHYVKPKNGKDNELILRKIVKITRN